MSKLLTMLLTLAIGLAVGGCPCGLGLLLGTTAGRVPAVAVKSGHCPACAANQTGHAKSGHVPNSTECVASVAGDLPASPDHAPAVVAIAPAVQPLLAALIATPQPAVAWDAAVADGLPPPPTLLRLGCALNT